MCDPVTIGIATAALSIGGSVLQHVGTNQQYEANRQAANYNYAQKRDTLSREQVQLERSASETGFDTAIAGLEAQGNAVAAGGEHGLAPSSLVQGVNASMFGIGRSAGIEAINTRSKQADLAAGITGAGIARQSQINSAKRSSLLGLAVDVGKGALAGVNASNSAKAA